MSRSIYLAAAAMAAALVPQVPAAADSGTAIIVTAPPMRGSGEPANGVQQRKRLVAHVAVDTSDLDLRTAYGRNRLDQRLRVAADMACDRLDAIDPPAGVGAAMNPDSGDCRSLAYRRAEPQMRRAIARA